VRDRELPLIDPEITVQREPGPVHVLHGQRSVEQVLVTDCRQHRGIAALAPERDRRVAGDRADADEHHDARQHEDDEGGSQLA